MVLWELTAITAYFLGLRRTYRLALRIQRRLIPPNHPRIRDFVYRRTRDVFNVAVSVHKNIQQRDIEVGRNLGNAILRLLDRMKPSAEIRPRLPEPPNGSSEQYKHFSSTSRSAGAQKTTSKTSPHDSNGKMLFSRLNIRPKSFPVLPTMTQPNRISASSQCRRFSYSPFPSVTAKRKGLMEGVFPQGHCAADGVRITVDGLRITADSVRIPASFSLGNGLYCVFWNVKIIYSD